MPASTYQHEVYMSALYTDPNPPWFIQYGHSSSKMADSPYPPQIPMTHQQLLICKCVTEYSNTMAESRSRLSPITSSLFAFKELPILLMELYRENFRKLPVPSHKA